MESALTLPGILGLAATVTVREELLDALRSWLGQCGLASTEHDPCTHFYTVNTRGRALQGVAHVSEGPLQLTSYVVFDRPIPESRRQALSELALRANFDLGLGTFEYDPGSGLLRHRSSLVVDGLPLTVALVAHVIEPGLWTFASYLPVLDIVLEGQEPLAALQAHCDRLARGVTRA